MKILMFTWASFGDNDILDAFGAEGHSVVQKPFDRDEGSARLDPTVTAKLESTIREVSPDFVYTFNYFPVIALACKNTDTRYVSWVYDSPVVALYSYTIIFPTNYVFVFDSDTYLEFHNQGIETVHFMPMAASPDRLMAMQDWDDFQKTMWNNETDIAFIGSLYTEKHNFYDRLKNITPYTRGYLEGIMEAQRQVYGYNFVESLLTEDIMQDMYQDLPMDTNADGVERKSWMFAQYVLNRQITAIERTDFLNRIGSKYKYDLYTPDKEKKMQGAINHGQVDYYDYAPYVFKKAKINLNISLRSIVNGIPLRCFDIMGNGGFLFTNYQGDFEQFFEAGKDYVFYESADDMMNKLAYYLAPENEAERAAIAQSGLKKINAEHTYRHRVCEIIDAISK